MRVAIDLFDLILSISRQIYNICEIVDLNENCSDFFVEEDPIKVWFFAVKACFRLKPPHKWD